MNEELNEQPRDGIFKRVAKLEPNWDKLPRVGFGDLVLDTETLLVVLKEGPDTGTDRLQSVALTQSEMEILRLLIILSDVQSTFGAVVSTPEFQEWLDYRVRIPKGGVNAIGNSTRVEDNMLISLRKKLRSLPGNRVTLVNTYKSRWHLERSS